MGGKNQLKKLQDILNMQSEYFVAYMKLHAIIIIKSLIKGWSSWELPAVPPQNTFVIA